MEISQIGKLNGGGKHKDEKREHEAKVVKDAETDLVSGSWVLANSKENSRDDLKNLEVKNKSKRKDWSMKIKF